MLEPTHEHEVDGRIGVATCELLWRWDEQTWVRWTTVSLSGHLLFNLERRAPWVPAGEQDASRGGWPLSLAQAERWAGEIGSLATDPAA